MTRWKSESKVRIRFWCEGLNGLRYNAFRRWYRRTKDPENYVHWSEAKMQKIRPEVGTSDSSSEKRMVCVCVCALTRVYRGFLVYDFRSPEIPTTTAVVYRVLGWVERSWRVEFREERVKDNVSDKKWEVRNWRLGYTDWGGCFFLLLFFVL